MTASDYANLLIFYMAIGMVIGAVCVGFAYMIRDWWSSHWTTDARSSSLREPLTTEDK